jgi:O-acetylhomoserine (thiol)-lyase
MVMAEWLQNHPAVAWCSYAGLPGSTHHDAATKYLPRGAGSIFTIGLKGGYAAGVRAVERCELFSHLANIGDAR